MSSVTSFWFVIILALSLYLVLFWAAVDRSGWAEDFSKTWQVSILQCWCARD